MRRWLVTAVVVLVASVVVAGTAAATPATDDGQDPPTNGTWERTYDSGGGNEVFFDAVPTADGFLLVGTAEQGSYGSEQWDGWLVKVNESGAVEWERTVGGSGAEVFTSVVATDDGFVVGGMANASSRYGGNSARWLVSIGPDGERRWGDTYEPDGGFARIEGLSRTGTGDVIAVGGSGALRVEPTDGESVWRQTYGNAAVVTGIVRTGDGYALSGTGTAKSSVLDGWLAMLAANGSLRWERHYVREGFNRPEALAVTSGGEYVLGGRSDADGTSEIPAWVVGTDATGDVAFERYLRDSTADGWVFGMTGGPDGSTVLAGKSIPGSGWVLKLDDSGETVATRDLGNVAKNVVALGGGRYLAVGGSRRPADAVAHVVSFVPPAAALRAEREQAAVGEAVTFDASGSRGASEFRWDFDGDGEIDRRTADPRTSYAFTRVGTRRVTVTVGEDEGTSSAATATVNVTDRTAPEARLRVDPETALVGTTVRFDASGSIEAGRVVAYRWDLDGDGEYERTTRESAIRGTVDSTGPTQVRVQVVDTAKNTDTATVVVRGRANQPPELTVTVDDDLRPGVLAVYEANVTDDTGAVEVVWEFPEGQKTGEEVVARLDAGDHTIRVVARDEFGATTVRNVTVSVPADGEDTAAATTTGAGPGFTVSLAVIAVLLWAVAVRRRR